MYPEICKIGPFVIYSYGLTLVIAFGLSSWLLLKQAKKTGFNPDEIFNLVFLVFISGIIGARIFYVITNIGDYLRSPLEIFMLSHGGLSWFGGLFLGATCGILYLKKKKLGIYKVLDLIVPFIALGHAIGRIGCFLNGCCFGSASGFPPQILSSLILLLFFVVLRLLQDRPHLAGEIFYSYLFLYSIKRFFIEFLRVDNPEVFLGLTLFQVISVLIFIFSLANLIRIKRAK